MIALCLYPSDGASGRNQRYSDMLSPEHTMPGVQPVPPSRPPIASAPGGHPCLTLSDQQIETALEDGRKLFRERKPYQDVFAGWRSRRLRSASDSIWLSPAALFRELGYVAEQRAWDSERLAPKMEDARRIVDLKTLIFQVYMRAEVLRSAMASRSGATVPLADGSAPTFGAAMVTITDDKGNRFPAVEERYAPAKTDVQYGGSTGWPIPGGGYYAQQKWYYTATYNVEFHAYSPDGSPRLTTTTKTLTVEFPELGEKRVFEVPQSWDGSSRGK